MFRNEVSSGVIDNIFAAARCVCSKIVKLTPFTPGKNAEIDESLFRKHKYHKYVCESQCTAGCSEYFKEKQNYLSFSWLESLEQQIHYYR